MSWLEIWFSPQQVERLGWALLHFVWQGAVAAWFLEIALTCLRNRSSQSRYLAGCIVLGVMACLPILTMSLVDVPDRDAATIAQSENAAAAVPKPSEKPLAALAPATRQNTSPTQQTAAAPAASAPVAAPTAPPAAPKPWVTISFADPESILRPILPWLVAAWVMGVITLSTRLLSGWLQAQRLKHEGTEPMALEWEVRFLELCQRLAIQKPVDLATSAMAVVPMTIGWVRPIVLVPASAVTGLSAHQLEAILAHELAHIRRHDYLFNLIQSVIETLLFYHPAVWWVSRRIRAERENCCDDLAVMACGDALMYAKALTRLEEMRWPAPQLAVAATGGQLLSRVQRLLGVKAAQQPIASRWMAGGMALGVAMFLWLTLGLAWPPASAKQPTMLAQSAPSEVQSLNPAAPNQPAANVTVRQPPAEPSRLRYGWKRGEVYSYTVRIELDPDGDYAEVLTGNSSFHVTDVSGDTVTLTHRGHLVAIPQPPKPGSPFSSRSRMFRGPMFMGGMGPASFGGEEIRVNSTGRVTRTSGETQLPWALGSMSQLMIEPLPVENRQSWDVHTTCMVEMADDSDRPGPRFGPFRSSTVKLSADESIHYEVVGSVSDVTEIRKRYELKTEELAGDKPRFEMRGDGLVRFDSARGVPTNLDFKMTVFSRSGRVQVEVPMKITYRLLDAQELAAAKNVEPPKPKPLTDQELTAAIEDLSDPSAMRRNASASRLARAAPSEDRTKVVAALLPLLEDRDDWTRHHAVDALQTWGGAAEAVPQLIKLLDDSAFHVRRAAFEALGASGDARAAEPIAEQVPNRQYQRAALDALKALGPKAEPAVRGLLKSDEWSVRLEACRILKDSGSPDSVAALEEALKDENGLVKAAADEALRAIANRRKNEI